MSDIDWSKAPEGAEYWCEMQWFKTIDGEWFVWCPGVSSWVKPAYSAPDNFSWWGNAVPRPSTTWNGTGLPPVGTVCELRLPPGGWGRATITHQGKGLTAWLWDHVNPDQVEHAERPDRLEFRPIRTPEQIAAEEREKAVAEMQAMIDNADWSTGYSRAFCEMAYDAGYRKTKGL